MTLISNKSVGKIILILSLLFLSSLAFAHSVSEADKVAASNQGALWFIWFGATHMLTGYDHLLFVFGVVFFLTRFFDILKYVTGFTIGHTLTLISATYAGLQINAALIDAFIALSVVYIAFVNLGGFQRFFKTKAPNLFVMVCVIGLVHGIGLSTSLQETISLNTPNLLLKIVSFNVGVELGQIAALLAMLVVLKLFRGGEEDTLFSRVSNFFIASFGVVLFFHQLHIFQHQVNASEFKPHHAHVKQNPASKPHRHGDVVKPPSATSDKETKKPAEASPHTHGDGVPHTH